MLDVRRNHNIIIHMFSQWGMLASQAFETEAGVFKKDIRSLRKALSKSYN